ncbi:MAG: hypothetical protein SGI71_02870 [Verrucomicrobiota bacterium]|nr:hypothetical protein [Verrucomicrobiota bacterium]
MSEGSTNQFFDVGDKTALVCVDNIEYQNMVVNALTQMGYKIHVGFFLEDIAVKVRSHQYDVIVIYEAFMGMTLADNAVLMELQGIPMTQRRFQTVVLLGESMPTADRLSGFLFSVTLTVNPVDLQQIDVLIRRCVLEQDEFYHTFKTITRERG